MVEWVTVNHQVPGSSPGDGAKIMLNNLSLKQKIAAGFFIFGKINSIFCALVMFVDVRVASVLLCLAVFGIIASVVTCLIDITKDNKEKNGHPTSC